MCLSDLTVNRLSRDMSMKTEIEKMRSQEQYDCSEPDIYGSMERCKPLCARLLTMTTSDEGYRELIEQIVPGFPKSSTICPPFVCDHGSGIIIAEDVFINYNCSMLDEAYIRIGRHTLIGPDCKFYTPQHPMNYIDRRRTIETAYPITIGEDCWLGGNVTVCPGVTIGDRCIIAAGSVVVHDIPSDSMAAGCPATVKKSLK